MYVVAVKLIVRSAVRIIALMLAYSIVSFEGAGRLELARTVEVIWPYLVVFGFTGLAFDAATGSWRKSWRFTSLNDVLVMTRSATLIALALLLGVFVLDRGADGCTLYGRGCDIEEIETALQFDKDVCRWRVLGSAADVRRSDARTQILKALEDEAAPMSPREIAIVSGQKDGAVRFLLHKMAKAGEVTKAGRGKYLHSNISPPNNANIANEQTTGHAAAS